ncbi:MAG: hypothetical protein AAFP00_03750, partial [Bacteroidota bacterium]
RSGSGEHLKKDDSSTIHFHLPQKIDHSRILDKSGHGDCTLYQLQTNLNDYDEIDSLYAAYVV